MNSQSVKKKKPRAESDLHAGHEAIRAQAQAQIFASAGLPQSGNRVQDPIYHLSSQLTQNFNEVGRRKNAERHEGEKPKSESEHIAERREQGERRELSDKQINELRKKHDSPVYSHTAKQLKNGDFCDRFSNYAFANGNLAASVFTGESKTMFTSCLRRGAMRQGTERDVQKSISGGAEKTVPLDGQPAKLKFSNSSVSKNVGLAAGIVVDSIRSSIQVMDMFRQLVTDSGSQPKNWFERRGVSTLKQMYPFMNIEEDEALVAKYKAELKQLGDDSTAEGLAKRRVLGSALKKAEAVQERKLSEQRKFLTRLDEMLNNAREAEKMFLSDDFLAEAAECVSMAYDNPPDDGDNRRRADNIITQAGAEKPVTSTEKKPNVKRRKQRTQVKPEADAGEAAQRP